MEEQLLEVCFIHAGDETGAGRPDDAGEETAARERPDNVRVVPLAPVPGLAPRAAVERLRLWENGKRLRIRFLDGDSTVQDRIATIAPEWEQYTNLTLDFVRDGDAEIRISFLDRGFSWSTVGTDALNRGRVQATMNYGWLTPSTGEREYRRVVLHEFGHALGMIHEHQNPAAEGEIPWDKPRVYEYYARQSWSRQDVDDNIFDVYAVDATNFTSFDSTSIMQYAVPDELTIGTFAIPWNTELSATDEEFMKRQYPDGSPGVVELDVGAAPHEADLGVAAEVDMYRFDVPTPATYIMTTAGTTDVVLTLQGPEDPGAVLAWDDDRGRGVNARIVRKLLPGAYWLGVRHKTPAGAGSYAVGVKTRRQ